MFLFEDHIAIPDSLGSRKRRRVAPILPRRFWAVSDDDHELIGIVELTECCKGTYLRDLLDPIKFESFRRDANLTNQFEITSLIGWRIGNFEPSDPGATNLPNNATKKWHGVCGLNAACPEVLRMHRHWNIPLGMKAFIIDHRLKDAVRNGDIEWIPTMHARASQGGLQLNDLHDGKPEPVLAHEPILVGIPRKFAISFGFSEYNFSVPCLMSALELFWSIRNTSEDGLNNVIRLAWRASLPVIQSIALHQQLADRSLRIPGRSVLRHATTKLDVMYSLFQRHVLDHFAGWRYALADSSKIRSQNWFALREDRILWPLRVRPEDVRTISFADHFESRHLPCSTFGVGASGELWKTNNFAFCGMLESGSLERFSQWRWQLRGICSDHGDEEAIVDEAVTSTPFCTEAEQIQLADCKAAGLPLPLSLYLLPLGLYVPDMLHIVFNALEEAVAASPLWPPMEKRLRALSAFFKNRTLVQRFVMLLVEDQREKKLLEIHVGELTDWKWEYITNFLNRLRIVLPIVLRCYNSDRFRRGQRDGTPLQPIDTVTVEAFEDALGDPLLLGKANVVRCIAFTLDRRATRLEGCKCHEFLLRDEAKPWHVRVREYRLASAACFWKGRWIIALCLGMGDTIISDVSNASDAPCRETLDSASVNEKQVYLSFER